MAFFLLTVMVLFVLWLGTKILAKAGHHQAWILCLLIPVVNIIMIWIFAFSHWPNLKPGIKQDL